MDQSYGVRLTGHNWRIFTPTLEIFRSAVKDLIDVVLEHYDDIENRDMTSDEEQTFIKNLVHSAKGRKAAYPFFDKKYHKYPSELLKSTITTAIGLVKSYKELMKQWEEGGRKGKAPRLNRSQAVFPCLFHRDMFKRVVDDNGNPVLDEKGNPKNECQIKLYIKNDWVWVTFHMKKSDVEYIKKQFEVYGIKEKAPVLIKRMHKYELRFQYVTPMVLPNLKYNNSTYQLKKLESSLQRICAVDLGVNNDAVCSIIKYDGTVAEKEFIKFKAEKDHMYKILGRISDSMRHGNYHNHRLWRFVDNYNEDISIKTAVAIIDFALLYSAQVIVLEHLDIKGKKRGSRKQRLHMWRKKDMLNRVTELAHKYGMRVATVNAFNTSRLAYDGSGPVTRGYNGNYSVCMFMTGKIYNCDLSASYNIGARYLIREFLKTVPETVLQSLKAKVPEAFHRTQCTLSTLISLRAAAVSSGIAC